MWAAALAKGSVGRRVCLPLPAELLRLENAPMSGRRTDGSDETALFLLGPDAAYLELLGYVLEAEGFTVRQAEGQTPPAKLLDAADVIVVDHSTSRSPPLDLLERMRRRDAGAPATLVVLTGKASEPVAKAPAGATRQGAARHDAARYVQVCKSAGPRAIVAGIRRALRRYRPSADARRLDYADVEMDTATHRVRRGERSIHLTPIEYRLLKHFLAHPEEVFTREQLAEAAWSSEAQVGERTVDVHVGRLRRALGAAPDDELIRTVRSVGYALSGK